MKRFSAFLTGEYFMRRGAITPTMLKSALCIKIFDYEMFGELARKITCLTPEQVLQVFKIMIENEKKELSKKKFCEIANELGFMSSEDIETIMKKQEKSNRKIGDILVEKGYLTEEKRNGLFYEFHKLAGKNA